MKNSIRVTFPGGVRADAHFMKFAFPTDQPVADGGTSTAPSPFDYFLASLAACAGYYVVTFCVEREIPTEGLGLSMSWERNPDTHMISLVKIDITLPYGFPEKYKAAILKAADQCTVKRHMLKPPAFEITAK
jgi:putative redox protein